MSDDTSLLGALSEAGIASDNYAFVPRLMAAVGIFGYRAKKVDEPYVIATRRDGLPDLRIYFGYTTGFTTEQEASRLAAALGVEYGPSGKLKGKWYVGHPVNGGLGPRMSSARPKQRETGRCPRCGIYELSVAGTCPGCDDD